MTASEYGSVRATDADRENVRSILVDAHAEGRLTWDEFDSRTTGLLRAQTYDQLAVLTADLPNRIPATPPKVYEGQRAARGTNSLAIASLACGICQVPFLLLAGVPAIVLGHRARGQIRQTGEDGAGLAKAGLILGYTGVALTLAFTAMLITFVVWVIQSL
ncbi:MAG TPA: DUF1707 and DUF4190 domain-containing protein [Streptosporangiaceae bacterium]|nr:DUF1707 and DUF4190 domain-containing protein [Streptosporangiaceae bacterium]